MKSLLLPVSVLLALVAGILGFAAPALANTPINQVVQLGDSYSAGYGVLAANRAATGADCGDDRFFDTSAVPGGRLAASLGVPLEFQACGGAEIPDVVEQFRTAQAAISGDGSGTLIVFTAGGNDVRSVRGEMWTDLLQRCILWDGSCERRSANQLGNLDAVAQDMSALVDEIATALPGAQIRVLGYPELFQRTPGCWGVTGVDRREADFLDGLARELNDALEAAVVGVADASGGDIAWVDVETDFDDHGACQTEWSGERFVNDTEFVPWTLTVAANSFHPTAQGYDAYSRALTASI